MLARTDLAVLPAAQRSGPHAHPSLHPQSTLARPRPQQRAARRSRAFGNGQDRPDPPRLRPVRSADQRGRLVRGRRRQPPPLARRPAGRSARPPDQGLPPPQLVVASRAVVAAVGRNDPRPRARARLGRRAQCASARSRIRADHRQELSSPIVGDLVGALYNLCRLNKPRQRIAAEAGAIGPLVAICRRDTPVRQLARPIICELAHGDAATRKLLWPHGGPQIYVELLLDPYWAAPALEAIAAWCVGSLRGRRLTN